MNSSHSYRAAESDSSDLLADIALSTLGIVMIIMLVYMLKHRDIADARFPLRTSDSLQMTSEEVQALRDRNQQLDQQVRQLNDELKQSLENQQLSGLWRFRTQLSGLVDSFGQVTPADWTVDYYMHLDVNGADVSGTLFGVRENDTEHDGTSATRAKISGKLGLDGRMAIELFFTGQATGGSEIIVADLKDRRFIGQLKSGSHKPGYRNYVGQTIGMPLANSTFVADW